MVANDEACDARQTTNFIESSAASDGLEAKIITPSAGLPSRINSVPDGADEKLLAGRVIVEVDKKHHMVPEDQVRDGAHSYKNWLLRIRSSIKLDFKTVMIAIVASVVILSIIFTARRTLSPDSSTTSQIGEGTTATSNVQLPTVTTTASSFNPLPPTTTDGNVVKNIMTTSGELAKGVPSPTVNSSIIISSTMKFPVTSPSINHQKKLTQTSTTTTETTTTSDDARSKLREMIETTVKTGEMFNMNRFIQENKRKANYMIGVGRGDITGPAAEVNMMGYGNMEQQVTGIHTRLYARTFMIGDRSGSGKPFLFINTDACMGASLLKLEVLKKIKEEYGDEFNGDNICITGTHTHSAPAGYLQDALFQVTSKGYIPQTLDTMVHGIMVSIKQAKESYAPGFIFMNKGELLHTNINRSPAAYLSNPLKERRQYKYDVDKEMTLLKFVDAEGNGIGMINWFPVHCTSMNNTNTLISSDNKGYAEQLFEKAMDPDSLIGESKFVAAFAQSHEGDVSPNTKGPRCTDTGLPCHAVHSTCKDPDAKCIASGPGKDMFESTKIIGHNQYVKAMELYDSANQQLKGPVTFIKQNINMTNQIVKQGNKTYHTCLPAMGFSFAAGTTDGPGAFSFKQGDIKGNPLWTMVGGLLKKASPQQIECHHPKPILIDSGEMTKPYEWQPKVVETQVLRIGSLIISAIPAEFTTMSGRRLIKAIRKVLEKEEPDVDFELVIAGLSNAYSDYVATFEEYQVQRYEGASTIYGPHTLQAYIQQYEKLTSALLKGNQLPPGPEIINMRSRLYALQLGVFYDRSSYFYRKFGHIYGDLDAKEQYNVGEEVRVVFIAGHPKNSYGKYGKHKNFMEVKREVNGTWVTIHSDADWCTKFVWTRERSMIGDTSEAETYWKIPLSTPSGNYRLHHYGHYKKLGGKIVAYEGQSRVFRVINNLNNNEL